MNQATGTLYLIPCPLGDMPPELVLPTSAISVARQLNHFIVEQPKTARRFLSALEHPSPIQSLHFSTLNEHTRPDELSALLAPLLAGHDAGIISEAGCPGVADPGAELVNLAHRKGIRVIPLVGPSSILLALMASGMNGQSFAFHGYLPISEPERNKMISTLENESASRKQTQMFIETPYRNEKLFNALLSQCRPQTQLCIATDISMPEEQIYTRTIAKWKSMPSIDINKRPSLFLLLAVR